MGFSCGSSTISSDNCEWGNGLMAGPGTIEEAGKNSEDMCQTTIYFTVSFT